MITGFEADHLRQMDLRPSEAARLEADPRMTEKTIALATYGYGVTLWYADIILGVCGYIELWPGVYEVWAFPSVHVEKFAVIYLRRIKRYIQAIEKSHAVRRLQTSTPADKQHNDWMEFLGFKCETPGGMANYSVLDETYNMWSRTYGKSM